MIRSPFWTKHINNGTFIKDLSKWHQWYQYSVTWLHLEINDNFSHHTCHLIIDTGIIVLKNQRENLQTIDNSNKNVDIEFSVHDTLSN